MIHGSKIMTLKGAIRKYCKRDFNVKWHIDHSRKLFTGDNRRIAMKYFSGASAKLDEVKKKAKEGQRYYEKLEKLARENKTAGKEIDKTLKRIKKLNRYMETDYMAQMVMESLVGLNYTLRPAVYQSETEQNREFMDIAEQGEVLMYGMIIAADEIKQTAEKTVVKYAKEHPVDEQTNGKKE